MSNKSIEPIEGGSVTSTPGFEAAGVSCGLKMQGELDLALVHAGQPCADAAVFTTNAFKAAPVLYDQRILTKNPGGLRAVVINSGCANACTGERGMRDAEETAGRAAEALGIAPDDVMVMSTGVIGEFLPMEKILPGVEQAARALSSKVAAGHAVARAIMTTDTRPKERAARVNMQKGSCTIAGMAKGSGMIHPNMATLLSLLTTDAPITPDLAQAALDEAVDRSFHRITVDGDTSTNDTVLLMANGQANMPIIVEQDSAAYRGFVEGLSAVALDLAKDVIRDAEGATHFIEITVRGARTFGDAKRAAMSVATSSLVKAAIYGEDANWGRIICAVGYSGVDIDPDRVSVWLDDLQLVRDGAPYHIDEERASALLERRDVCISVDLGLGDAQTTVWTSDLTHEYVTINAHYRT
ncbi:MAG: bifunctional glutamate N-acetyltransferase/amino-acid acetyltransferase ArgJ [Chloroflexota bacterium]|nr:bifunctional glutamate N-acetyltransferase/amino-acid acetyltransferase ArgJ [Chloroflexota bacterium]